MNFFQQQALARRKSYFLVLAFSIAIATIIAIIDVLLLLIGCDRGTILAVSASLLIFILMTSWMKYLDLRYQGGAAIANYLNSTLIDEYTDDLKEKRLRNILEEISISSSVPAPSLYLMRDEKAINALIVGNTQSDAAVIVTQGALDSLDRDELQAIMAHEFSHLLNGDMKLNMTMIAMLEGLTIISSSGARLIDSVNDKNDTFSFSIKCVGIFMFIIGGIGLILSSCIKSLINHQREYLADASAVQYTRLNTGLMSALEKIAYSPNGSFIKSVYVENISHLFFSQGGSFSLIASHPSLTDRIKKLDPRICPELLEKIENLRWTQEHNEKLAKIEEAERIEELSRAGIAAIKTQDPKVYAAREKEKRKKIASNREVAFSIIENIGAVTMLSATLLDATTPTLPRVLTRAAHHHHAVIPLLFSFLYSSTPYIQTQQRDTLSNQYGKLITTSASAFYDQVTTLSSSEKMSLLLMTFPALRRHPAGSMKKLIEVITLLINLETGYTLTEYCFAQLIRIQVCDLMLPTCSVESGNKKMDDEAQTISFVLSIMASAGANDEKNANIAYEAGRGHALPNCNQPFSYEPFDPEKFNSVLPVLDALELSDKQRFIEALIIVMTQDQLITPTELQFLRILCGCMHCPLPINLPPSSDYSSP